MHRYITLFIFATSFTAVLCCSDVERHNSVKQTSDMVLCLQENLFSIADFAADVQICCEFSANGEDWPPFPELMKECLVDKWNEAISSCKVNEWNQAEFIRCNIDKSFIEKLKVVDINCSRELHKESEYPKVKGDCNDWFAKYKDCLQSIGNHTLQELGERELSEGYSVRDMMEPFYKFMDGKTVEDRA